jgi:hypothetical protein
VHVGSAGIVVMFASGWRKRYPDGVRVLVASTEYRRALV